MKRKTFSHLVLRALLVLGCLAFAGSAAANGGRPPIRNTTIVLPNCGETLLASVTLPGDLDCSGYGGTYALTLGQGVALNLGGHTLTLNPTGYGVANAIGANAVSVTNGTIVGGVGQVFFAGSTHDSATGLTLTGSTQPIVLQGTVAATVAKNTIATIVPGGLDIFPGVWAENSASDVFTGNTVTNATYGFWLQQDSNDQILGNHASPASTGDGYFVDGSDAETLQGNVATGGANGFDVENGGNGTVTLVGNTASGCTGAGFYLREAYLAPVLSPPWTAVSGNKSIGGGEGFYDFESYGATWTGNTATASTNDGFTFDHPARETITHNTGNGNGLRGFYILGNAPPYDAASFSLNTAKSNQDWGFHAESGTPGKGNVGTGNTSGDCYDVVCVGKTVVSK